jgi:hypothetical protein
MNPPQPLPRRQPRGAVSSQPKRKNITPAQRERRRARNSRRRMNRRSAPAIARTAAAVTGDWLVPGGSSSDTAMRRMARVKMAPGEKLTQQGLSFLKCAFAPPDFAGSDLAGVPDDFHGVSLVKKHRLVNSQTFAANVDYYYLLLPSPGISFWYATVTAGSPITATTVFTGIGYSDFFTMFGGAGNNADIVTKFRYVSNHFELIPTVNQMNWTGNIQVFRFPLDTVMRDAGSDIDTLTVTGLQCLNSTNSMQYTGSFNMGVYTAAYNTGTKFDFQPIMENRTLIPHSIALGTDFGQLTYVNGIPGIDGQFDSLCIKITGIGANTQNSAIFKTWSCVEYQVVPGNLLYEFATMSPTDAVAMKFYRSIIADLPIGVPFYDNASFWQRILQLIKQISGGLSILPGPVGMISGGVNSIASGIESLVL